MGLCGGVIAGVDGAGVLAVPVANLCRSPIGCSRSEIGREVRGGFVLLSKAWAGFLIGAAIDGFF